ncbi:MAG: hypothetical protein COC05_01030 [Gammaproteobacteria bacterium]|nr:MAG: hypothetical protein COC05_01030 [Gammaproteobacteria bacterium]
MTKFKTVSKLAAVAITAGMLFGCSHADLKSAIADAQSTADAAAADAADALSAANSAQSTATNAQSTADAAQRDADAAYSLASDANDCCEANTDRLDRMFKKSMQK